MGREKRKRDATSGGPGPLWPAMRDRDATLGGVGPGAAIMNACDATVGGFGPMAAGLEDKRMRDDGTALLAAIRANPAEMTPQLLYRDWSKENPDRVREMMEYAMWSVPRLIHGGIGVEHHVLYEYARNKLFSECDGFAASMAWLATKGKRKTGDHSSYWYKHQIEDQWNGTAWPIYVDNGAFIAAVICSRFNWYHSPDDSSPNVLVGISRRPRKPTYAP